MKNVYFSHGTSSEQRLYEDLIIESLKIYGFDVYYLPREFSNDDRLFGEDPLAKFDENYMIEMYLSNYDGFSGDGTLLTKFGVRISEEATFIISKRRWEDLISSSNNLLSSLRPNEGDVIYFPPTGQFFQIKFVEHNKPFRQLDAIQTYQLIAETMEFSHERLETGVPEIDNMIKNIGYSIVFNINYGIKYVYVTNQGSGYGSNTTVQFGPPGVEATASAIVTNTGSISGVNIISSGYAYTYTPYVNILGSGTGATAVAVTANSRAFKQGEIVRGTKYTARATPTISSGSVNSIAIRYTGEGYETIPTITISAPPAGGTQATAVAVLTNKKVTSINITNPGSGYLVAPELTIGSSPLEPYGTVARYDFTNKQLEVSNIVGNFSGSTSLIGDESGSEWTIAEFNSLVNENDPLSENDWFEDEADKIVDWTERNPFGEYSNMDVNASSPISKAPTTPTPTPTPPPPIIQPNDVIGGIVVDTSNIGAGTDNYIMVYDADTNKYIFVSPQELGVNNDSNPDPNIDDFGSY